MLYEVFEVFNSAKSIMKDTHPAVEIHILKVGVVLAFSWNTRNTF